MSPRLVQVGNVMAVLSAPSYPHRMESSRVWTDQTKRPVSGGRPRLPRLGLPARVLAGLATLTLLAACGGSPSSTSHGDSAHAGGSRSSQLLAFSECMRSHGVPNFPDATSSGKFPGAQHLGVSSSRFRAAENACKRLLPNGGSGSKEAELQLQMTAQLPFARCMRSHGVSNWPDPSIHTNPDGITAVVFYLVGVHGLAGRGFDSPQVQAAVQQCQHLLPPSLGGQFRIMR